MNPVERFVDAINRGDVQGVADACHPDFEMIVPQHPARGFTGRDQEVKNMADLIERYPDGRIEVQRMVDTGAEVWIENTYKAEGLDMAAVVIFEIDRESDTIRRGRYYSEPVEASGPDIDDWIGTLGARPR